MKVDLSKPKPGLKEHELRIQEKKAEREFETRYLTRLQQSLQHKMSAQFLKPDFQAA